MISTEEYEREQARMAQERHEKYLLECGVPDRYVAAMRQEEKSTTPLDFVSDIKKGETWVLGGTAGIGKTYAACKWLSGGGGGRLFIHAGQLSRWARFDAREVDRLISPPRLVIDDVGTEYLDEPGAYLSTFQEVLSRRDACLLTTVMTTNLSGPEFKRRYSERIADRVTPGAFVWADGESLRRAT